MREGVAERLPDAVDEFDGTLAQLVGDFMKDLVAGLHDMVRAALSRGPRGLVSAGMMPGPAVD